MYRAKNQEPRTKIDYMWLYKTISSLFLVPSSFIQESISPLISPALGH